MSITSEIERIKTNIANAYTEIENKGVITTNAKNSDNLATTISAIQTGGTGGGDEELTNSFLSSIDGTLGANCTKLPDGITSLCDYAFYYRTNLALTELPRTITYIGKRAFYYCTNLALTEVWGGLETSSSSMLKITQYCYANCTKLKTIKVLNINNPNNMSVWLDNYCFYRNTGLTTVDLHEKITNINDYVFDGCTNLKTVICRAITPPKLYSTAFKGVTLENLYVPDESVETYRGASNWSKFSYALKPLSEYTE